MYIHLHRNESRFQLYLGSSTVYYQNPVQQYPWPVSSFQFPQGYRVVQGNRMCKLYIEIKSFI